MRVAVNLSWLVPGVVGGSEESTTRLLAGIADESVPDLSLTLFVVPAFGAAHPALASAVPTVEVPTSGRSKVRRVIGEYRWLPRQVNAGAFDVLHDAGGTTPGRVDCARVVTIHDIQPIDLPANFHPVKVAYLRAAIPRALRRADRVVVPSQFVKDRLVDRFAADATAIDVVPHVTPAIGHATDPADLVARYDLPERFVLLPAITYPHKRHQVVIEAIRSPSLGGVSLVLTGGPGPADQAVTDAIAECGVGDRVHRLGRIPEADLHGLYALAAAMVFPSVYEGFGLPALEAMAFGCPAIVADAGSLPEVVGDAAAVVPAADPAAWSDTISRVIDEDREIIAAAGRRHAAGFSATRAATAMVAAYRSAVADR